jgi:preprotein translocase subunit SecG
MFPLVRFLLGFTLVLTSLILIFLVLIQRGRGGGLAGAFGGMGGQSAFGTKAGDVFTKITVGVAAFWILLCVLAINVLGRQQSLFSNSLGSSAPEATTGSAGSMQSAPGTESVPAAAPAAPDGGSTSPAPETPASPAAAAVPVAPAAPAVPETPAVPTSPAK